MKAGLCCGTYIVKYNNSLKISKPFHFMASKGMMKRIFIAGASSAINYKERNPKATESEVMSHVTQEMEKRIEEIEKDG
jgi:hypothetical protein